jgi:hypothetical protein
MWRKKGEGSCKIRSKKTRRLHAMITRKIVSLVEDAVGPPPVPAVVAPLPVGGPALDLLAGVSPEVMPVVLAVLGSIVREGALNLPTVLDVLWGTEALSVILDLIPEELHIYGDGVGAQSPLTFNLRSLVRKAWAKNYKACRRIRCS